MWMNLHEIEESVFRFQSNPTLGPAARFLRAFADEVNAHSDGWSYWQPPLRAASQLMDMLLHARLSPQVTQDDVMRAIRPIKSFMTRRGASAGMSMPPMPFQGGEQ